MAAPALPPLLREGDRLSRDEFLRRWDSLPELRRAELIDGIVYMASPVSRPHARAHPSITWWLMSYTVSTPGVATENEGTWLMETKSAPQPDAAMIVLPEYGGQSREEGKYSAGAPELIAEVTMTSRQLDLGPKRLLYERAGVREYLTVLVEDECVIWRELREGRYRDLVPGVDGVYRSRVFPGLWLDEHALWGRDHARVLATLKKGLASPQHAAFVRKLARRKR